MTFFLSNELSACQYNVRETGFADFEINQYHFYGFVNSKVPEDIRLNFEKACSSSFNNSNVVHEIIKIEEPLIEALIITPDKYLGAVLKLLESRRGKQKKLEYISSQRIFLTYLLPLSEIVLDFYNQLNLWSFFGTSNFSENGQWNGPCLYPVRARGRSSR